MHMCTCMWVSLGVASSCKVGKWKLICDAQICASACVYVRVREREEDMYTYIYERERETFHASRHKTKEKYAVAYIYSS